MLANEEVRSRLQTHFVRTSVISPVFNQISVHLLFTQISCPYPHRHPREHSEIEARNDLVKWLADEIFASVKENISVVCNNL